MPMDFTGMKPSDALEKAHEAFPEIKWEWWFSSVHPNELCGCAVALLAYASGHGTPAVNSPEERTAWCTVGSMFGENTSGDSYHEFSSAISEATHKATSFPHAISLLRERGW